MLACSFVQRTKFPFRTFQRDAACKCKAHKPFLKFKPVDLMGNFEKPYKGSRG